MQNFTTISWPLFILIVSGLIGIWMITTKTTIGKTLLTRELPWSVKKWSRFLLMLGITAFIMVHPVFHVMGLVILGVLYYLFVSDRSLSEQWYTRRAKTSGQGESAIHKTRNKGSVSLVITDINKNRGLVLSRRALDKCIFSFPYISDKQDPRINYINDKYEVSVSLSSYTYIASFVDYIKQAGFEIEIKS